MSSDLAEFHEELRNVARAVFAGGAPDWQQVVDAGFTGLEVPEHFGGAGATFAETAVVLEEFGRAAARGPMLGAVVAVAATDDEQVLRAVAEGRRVAVAHDGFDLTDGRVRGRQEFVLDAVGADLLVIVTEHASAVVDPAELQITEQPVLDETRSFAIVSAEGAPCRMLPSTPDARERVVRRGAAAVALDNLGIAEAMTSATVEYAKVRHQFGRPIGSFQAVKHACADMAVKNAVARALVSAALTGDGRAVSMAKAYTSTSAVEVVGKAMQLHGGIGYTWESGVHTYLKRATLNRSLFGGPAEHRRNLSQSYTHSPESEH